MYTHFHTLHTFANYYLKGAHHCWRNVSTWEPESVLLLLLDTSFSRELNSLDNSSAVASDAFRSSFIDWTEFKAQKYHKPLASNHTFKHWGKKTNEGLVETYTTCCCQSWSENSWLWGSRLRLLENKENHHFVVSHHLCDSIFTLWENYSL